jgi:hypothetical protein
MKNRDWISTIVFAVALLFVFPVMKSVVTIFMLPDMLSPEMDVWRTFSLLGALSALIAGILAVPLGWIVSRRVWLFSGIGAAAVVLFLALGAPVIVRRMWPDFILLVLFSVLWSIAGYHLKKLLARQQKP